MKRLIAVVGVFAMSVAVAAASGFFEDPENFGTGFTDNQALTGGRWSSVSVVVTNASNIGFTNDWAAYFLEGSVATNKIEVSGPNPARVWTDFRIKPALGAEPSEVPAGAQAVFFFDDAGYIQYRDGLDWVAATNNIFGTSVTAVPEDTWVRVSVFQDYGTDKYAIMLEDIVIAQDVNFVGGASSAYDSFVVMNQDGTAYLDELRVHNSLPSGLNTDLSPYTLADAAELDQFGYVARTLAVDPDHAGAPAPKFATITAALDAWRTRDEITVVEETYVENVTVPSGVVLTLPAGTVIDGSLTVAVGGQVIAQGTLDVASLDVSGTLTAAGTLTVVGALEIAAGGTVTTGTGFDVIAGSTDIAGTLTVGGALTVAGPLGIAQGGIVNTTGNVAAASTSIAGTLTVGGTLGVTGEFGVAATGSVTLSGDAGVGSGLFGGLVTLDGTVSLTVTNSLAFDNNGTTSVTNAVLNLGANGTLIADPITMEESTEIVSTGGTLESSLKLTGTYTIAGINWGKSAADAPQTLPFTDDFERYLNGQVVQNLGLFGWDADSATVMVTNSYAAVGQKSVILPDGTELSLNISGVGHPRVWTDFYIRPSFGVGPGEAPDTAGKGFMSFVDNEGDLNVWVGGAEPEWRALNTIVAPEALGDFTNQFSTAAFTRVSVFQNFEDKQFAVFVGATNLVGMELNFPDASAVNVYDSFMVSNDGGSAYLDGMRVIATLPFSSGDPIVDTNDNGMDDREEIHWFGNLESFEGIKRTIFRFL